MNLKQRVLAGVGWIGGAVAAVAVLQLAQLTYLARALDTTSVGAIAVITMVVSLADILANVGLSNSLIQRQEVTPDEISSLYWLNAIWGIAIAAIVFVSASPLALFFRLPDLTILIQTISLAFVVLPHGQIYRGLLEKNLMFARAAAADIAWASSTLAICIALTKFGVGARGVVDAMVLGFAIKTVVLTVGGRNLFQVRSHFRFTDTKRFLSFGIYQVLDALVGFIGNNAGGLVVGRSLSAPALGGYNLAYTYAVNTPAKLNPVVTRVMFPAFSRIQNDRHKLAKHTINLIAVTGLINAAPIVGLILLADSFVTLILGSRWMWIVPSLRLLGIVGILRAFGNPFGIILMAIDRMRLGFWLNALKTLITLGSVAIGATLAGLEGTAIALVIISLLTLVLNYFLLRSTLGIRLGQYCQPFWLAARLVSPMVVVVSSLTVLGPRPSGASFPWFITETLAGGGTYLVTLLLTRSPLVAELRAASLTKLTREGRDREVSHDYS